MKVHGRVRLLLMLQPRSKANAKLAGELARSKEMKVPTASSVCVGERHVCALSSIVISFSRTTL